MNDCICVAQPPLLLIYSLSGSRLETNRLCLSFEALVKVVDRQPVPALARCPAPKAGTICNAQPRRRAAEKWGKRRGLGRR